MRALALALALALLAPAAARAGGFNNEDFGVRRMGMFATVANPDDGTAVFHNPAGLTLATGTRAYHSQSWFFADIGLRLYDSEGILRPAENMTPDWNIGFLPMLSLSSDLGTKRYRVGLAFYAPNAYGALMPEDQPTRYHLIKALFISARLTATGAIQVNDRLSVGFNLSTIYNYLTAEKMINPAVLQDPDNRFDPASETRDSDIRMELNGTDVGWGWDVGAILKPTPRTRFGIAFVSGTSVDLEGDVRLTYPTTVVDTVRHQTMMKIPFTLKAGVSYFLADDVELGADIRYFHYQVFQEQRTTLSEPILGQTEMVDPKNYGNSVNWCLGLRYQITPAVDLMLGYQQDYTPIPTRTFTLENPSRDQHGVSLGGRWQINPRHKVGVAFVRNWFGVIDIQDSITNPPSNAKGFGANSELGVDWQGSF